MNTVFQQYQSIAISKQPEAYESSFYFTLLDRTTQQDTQETGIRIPSGHPLFGGKQIDSFYFTSARGGE